MADIKTQLIVGMEVHVELATRSKMWTSAPNIAHPDYHNAEPNTLTSPVVIGMPGTLPVMNKAAVEMSMLVGKALGCVIARFTKWDRKSYYYPDLPKNYQISQYDLPLCFDGAVDVPLQDEPDAEGHMPTKRIGIIRAHLEEDAGKLQHEAPGGGLIDYSIVDLNRAGTPLLEIVTEPDFETADQCVRFAVMLRNICRHLGVTEGIMQRGHMRFEPNINVAIEKDGRIYKTPIVEIKNLNSFKALQGAVTYEYRRQIDEWLETGRVHGGGEKSTRGWDDGKEKTFLQREKEDAHDYRYFPDPDLVPLVVDDAWLADIESRMVELPLAREHRYIHDLGLPVADAKQLVDEPAVCDFYEEILAVGTEPREAAKLLLNYGAKIANEREVRIDQIGISAQQVADVAALIRADKVGSTAAATLFDKCCDSEDNAQQIAEREGLLQVSDTGALDGFIDQVLNDPSNAKTVEDIRGGKDKAVGALMGQIMKLSKGQANAKVVTGRILEKIRG